MFNARSESVATSRAFRGPFHRQRAILPASSFIEWQKLESRKQPYDIRVQNKAIAFAGVWDRWEREGEEIYSCSIITTDAAPQFAHIHSRMPVMLKTADFDAWLNPEQEMEALAPLLAAQLPDIMELTPSAPGPTTPGTKSQWRQ